MIDISEYKEQIDKMRWSYSRLSTFDTCKYCFYLNYIVADDDLYLSESNFYAELGNFIHDILEMIFSGKLNSEDALQYFVDNYDNNIFYKVRQSTMDKAFEQCVDYLSGDNFSWIENYEILGVELTEEFKIGKYSFTGRIDLLLRDKRDGKIVIMDHKSMVYPFKLDGGIKKAAEQNFNHYKKQMYLYCYAVKLKYGEFPKEITWNHFKENKFAIIPFIKADYYNAIKWFIDTIHIIEKEQNFEPNEDFFYCNNLCNFRNSCEYAIISRGA